MKTLPIMMAGLLFAVTACQPSGKEEADTAPTHEQMVERGAFLVSIMDCNVCHSPKVFDEKGPSFDQSRLLSGHPADLALAPTDSATSSYYTLAGPMFTSWTGAWGTSFAANLTPHETGLGNWTEEMFLNAMRTGKHMGMEQQRPIMPPMPWEALNMLPDDDLKAIWAYLGTLTPIENLVPAYMPPAMPAM